MIQELQQNYSGVLCSCCRQPIPLPAIIVRISVDAAETQGDRVFSLRCRACEKEMPYRASEVIQIEGTPRTRVSRAHDRGKLLRQQERLSRAANG
jgi:hypothetical protein